MTILDVPTSLGPARWTINAAKAPTLSPLLGHGAGGHIESVDLVALASALPSKGVTVARYEQPWRVAGKKIGPAPAALDTGWREGVRALTSHLPRVPMAFGGRSAGARVACRTALELDAVAVLALAFPLHAPGRPGKSREAELVGVGVPAMVVQGDKDPFGTASEVYDAVQGSARIWVTTIAGAGHDLSVPKRAVPNTDAVWRGVARDVADYLLDIVSA